MWVGVITLFPEIFTALESGITGRALQDGLLKLALINPRDFATDKHKTVDDHPYGGGPGMVMRPEPLCAAIEAAREQAPKPAKVIYLSPQGKKFTQPAARDLAKEEAVIFLAGRYEGIDQRVIETEIDEEWSIGDYILTGGELAAMVMIDASSRHIPGVVGDYASVTTDSLENGVLKYPQYTRPENFRGKSVPKVLLSGNHAEIKAWREQESARQTKAKRPDLLEK